ncbi:MAG: isoprenyl transferase [Syntrophales bacterium]|jgi:undecaprenyl diphosphate synthase|nr:isoprenyl transferase [Syntrophales bacterium]MDY0043792.1 isoprenyl transferase [Syntrophales bacterium]
MYGIDKSKLPRHVAIIMDGNGRWAKKNALKRLTGHKKGADAVRNAVRTCRELGIEYLTLYAFSVENWSRPKDEVRALMALLEEYLNSELQEMIDNGIKLSTIGNIRALPEKVQGILNNAVQKTAMNRKMVLTLALSYGGRDEIIEVVRKIVEDVEAGKLEKTSITKNIFSNYLFTSGMPDPDLLIRTSGEYRISNFLLWQMAYTEFYFADVLWPDFSKECLINAILDYQKRERRFGMTSDQLSGN